MRAPWRYLVLALALASPLNGAHAGSACAPKKTETASFVKAMQLAVQTREVLEESGAQVVLIARAGQDLSKYGQRFSHMAYAWRDHPKGRWLVVHELNLCGSAESALFDEGLANFFLDDMFVYEAAILVPGPESQARIAAMLGSGTPRRLHAARYNMLSHAFSTSYQNSNQWLLETYAASASEAPLGQRGDAQAWLMRAGYRPVTVHIPAMTRLGARMFRANIAFDDHPFERRMAGQIDTVTVDSVMRFVRQHDRLARDISVAIR